MRKYNFTHWSPQETEQLIKLYRQNIPFNEICVLIPTRKRKSIKSKLKHLFNDVPNEKYISRNERNSNILKPINWVTCEIEPLNMAKAKLKDRLREWYGMYYVDGKKVNIIQLIEMGRQ